MAAIQAIQQRLRQEQLYYAQEGIQYNDDYDIFSEKKETYEVLKAKQEKLIKLRSYKNSIKWVDTFAAMITMVLILLSVAEYEVYYGTDSTNHFVENGSVYGLRVIITLGSVILIILVILHNVLEYRKEREKKPLELLPSFISSKHFKIMLLEILINLIHNPPGLNHVFTINQVGNITDYSIDTFTTQIMLLRIYLLIRAWADYSRWTGEMVEQYCNNEGCEADTFFALKATFKDKPYTILLVTMCISIAAFGLALRAFERPVYFGQYPPGQDYDYLWNGMWCIIITMTTVGYGDFYPKTHCGRFVVILACFWGVFLISMMVVTLTVSSTFSAREQKAYDILYRLNIKEKIKKKASFIVPLSFRLMCLEKKYAKKRIIYHDYIIRKIKLKTEMQIKIEEFKEIRSRLPDYEISAEELLRQLNERIDKDFSDIKDVIDSLIKMEQDMDNIEKSQNAIIDTLNECFLFTNSTSGIFN